MDKAVATLVLLLFAVCVVGCVFAESSCDDTDHCVAHCSCCALSLAVGDTLVTGDFSLQPGVSVEQCLKLPLLAASIFNPPKL